MYLRREVVMQALDRLNVFHPFFGITFLVCKQRKLPVGRKVSFPINSAEEQFLRKYYHPDLKSKYFFSPFERRVYLAVGLVPNIRILDLKALEQGGNSRQRFFTNETQTSGVGHGRMSMCFEES